MWALAAETMVAVVMAVVVWRGTIVVAPVVVVVRAAAATACGAHTPLVAASSVQVAWNKYAH